MRRIGGARRRLARLREDGEELRRRLRVLDEEISHVDDVAEDARVRALVSESPADRRSEEEAREDARRARAQRDALAGRLARIEAEQDRLLERLGHRQAAGRGGRG